MSSNSNLPMSSDSIDIIIGADLFSSFSTCSKRFRIWAYRGKYDSRLDSFWTNNLISDYWVNFRTCASRSCWNSRLRSSLLGNWGSRKLLGAFRRISANSTSEPHSYTGRYIVRLLKDRTIYLDRRIALAYCCFELSPLGTTLNSRLN